mgnify:CR=1 FL=1
MAEVQSHGNTFEDIIIKKLTGKSKKEYDALKGKGGYTSAMDLVEGLIVNADYSIKTAKSNKVDCGDILRRMSEKKYIMIIGQWRQDGDTKVIHTVYCFNIKSKDYKKLWGKMTKKSVKEFDKYVKAYSGDNKDRDARKEEREDYKNSISDKNALMTIHPKLSGKQLRVQCSFKIDEMIAAGVEYMKKDNMNIVIKNSPPRNKK